MKQLILTTLLATLLFLSGCTQQPTAPKQPQIDPTLPIVKVNGHIESMSDIAIEWTPSKDTRVKGYHVYRSNPKSNDKKLSRHDSLQSRFVSHFTDVGLSPNTTYIYRFSTYNEKMQESKASKTFRITTKPLLTSVSFFDSIGNLPRIAKLIWRPHDNPAVKGYILERQTVEKAAWEEIARIDNRLQAEYIDEDLDDNHVYKYRLRALTYEGIKSTPSDIAKVITKPLPLEVQSVQATLSMPKQIKLTWQANSEKDIAHYNIYRSSSIDGSYDYYVKLNETHFIDKLKEDGKSYFYKVTATDQDGLEGLLQATATHGSSLKKPNAPTFLDAVVQNNSAVLTWKNNDARTKQYTVIKTTKQSWISSSSQQLTGITQETYTVSDLKPDTQYKFQVVALDANDIMSEPTEPVEVLFTAPVR